MLKRLLPFAVLFLVTESVLRFSLLVRSSYDVTFSAGDITQLFARGVWFDLVTASFFMLPVALYHLLMPASAQGGKRDRRGDTIFRFIFCFILLFSAVAEHLFWMEFNARFNFIAVDYLIYTREVVGNITESYPLLLLISCIGIGAALLTFVSVRLMPLYAVYTPIRKRAWQAFTVAVVSLCAYGASRMEQANFTENVEAEELASNGVYNLFYAFWHNEISYDRFYATDDEHDVQKRIRALLAENDEHATFVTSDPSEITRLVPAYGQEQRKNVMLVVMESMSADYMGVFGNTQGLTPNLDRLAREGLLFADTYATGTRTVRGLEAISLSVPPTPGQSIIRRPGNENLFSLGFVFQDRGYDTRFIYGGYGYFDNMNAFFANNGFNVVDRTDMPKDQIQFANVWGVSDEDLFKRTIEEADRSYAAGKPFMQLVMTTSNHRPFTYPEGRIDIPVKSGRFGGVKYADYSVGKLIEWSKTKPWFKDTVFVFVADHTAGAAGKTELDPHKYHIPMVFYAPGAIEPKRYEKIASQIDLAPVLLGILNFSYYSKFYGEDLLHDEDEIPHAFISNYQKVALVKKDTLTVLEPKRVVRQYDWPFENPLVQSDKDEIHDAIAYYQSASAWKQNGRRIASSATSPHKMQ